MRTDNSKKTPSEDRTKKKKPKPTKRRRRRRDSSLSSYSDDGSRGRRKAASRRAPKKPRRSPGRGELRRRKEPKKPDRKKPRRTSYRRDASVGSTTSGSSRSCSTCRGRSTSGASSHSDRSRSPVRADRKAKVGTRGRSRERRRRSSRKRSCSTCSGYASYSGSSSCSQSPSGDKYRHGGRSTSRRSVQEGRDKENRSRGEDKAKIIKAYDDFPSSRSNSSHSVERKREDRAKVPVAHQGESEKKSWPEGVEDTMRKDNATQTRAGDGIYDKGGEMVSSKVSTQPAESAGGGGRGDDKPLANEIGLTKDDATRKTSKVGTNNSGSEADDLEIILRQKALENFKKYQGHLSGKKLLDGYRQDESVPTECCKDTGRAVEAKQLGQVVKNFVTSLESKPTSSLEQHRPQTREKSVAKAVPRVSSLVISREENEGNPLVSSANDNESCKPLRSSIISSSKEAQSTPRQNLKIHETSNKMYLEQASLSRDTQDKRQDLKLHESSNKMSLGQASLSRDTQDKRQDLKLHESSNKMSSGQASVTKDTQDKKQSLKVHESSERMTSLQASSAKCTQDRTASLGLGSSKASGIEAKKADGSASGASSCQKTETTICNSTEPTTGSQFEQKTFSRMHDGEMVQVSYKVYIPKRSPALARRQLQR